LNEDDSASAFIVITPFDATLTKSSVYTDEVPNVIACPSGSVPLNVVIVVPLVIYSIIVWLPVEILGPVFG
jgi:hypothetical protein